MCDCNKYVTYIHRDIHTKIMKTSFTLGGQYIFEGKGAYILILF